MEKRRMDGVHGVFQDLQPVTRIEIFPAWHEPIAWSAKTIIHGKRRLLLRWPHIGKHDAIVLVGRVGTVAESVLQRTRGRLAWCLQDSSRSEERRVGKEGRSRW